MDAKKLALLDPTVQVPASEMLASALNRGWFVKVSAYKEKLWVCVEEVNGDTICGIVDNELAKTEYHGIRDGERVTFHVDCVLDVDTPASVSLALEAIKNVN